LGWNEALFVLHVGSGATSAQDEDAANNDTGNRCRSTYSHRETFSRLFELKDDCKLKGKTKPLVRPALGDSVSDEF